MLLSEDRIDKGFFPYEPETPDAMIHNDHLATPQKVTDSTGAVVWSADYKPFGEATVTVSTITNNLRFPGQYFDAETGLNYNLNRDYNQIVGRYVESDPIGLRGGINLYVYVGNNSIKRIDPKGLEAPAGALLRPMPPTPIPWGQIGSKIGSVARAAGPIVVVVGIVFTPSSTQSPEDDLPHPPITIPPGTLVPSTVDQPAPDLTGTKESCELNYQLCLGACDKGCQSTGSKVGCKTKCFIAFLYCMLNNM